MAAEPTWSVGELHAALNEVIEVSFGSTVWVTGELRSINRSNAGHVYFDLVDPAGEPREAPRLSVTLFNGYRQRVNAVLRKARADFTLDEGTVLRISGELRTYEARSRLQLVMTGIDPTFTIGALAQRREIVLAALVAEGLIDLNSRVVLPRPALRIGLVTSRGSAAEADVLGELRSSGIGFEVLVFDARTQGAQAETTIVSALRTAASLELDAVLLVRGGGSRSDLQVFDSEAVGRAIASMPVAVLTGIGHETDSSVADLVAHRAHKTPTACAAAVVESARGTVAELAGVSLALRAAARGRLDRSARALDAITRTTAVACRGHLGREERSVDERAIRLGGAATRVLRDREATLATAGDALRLAAPATISRSEQRLDRIASLVGAHDPARALAKGWSITRDGEGRVVRSVTGLVSGTEMLTLLSDGTVRSSVIDSEPNATKGSAT